MKTIKARLIAAAVLAILAAPIQSFGIVGLGIERQCTNIVISWPSQGYEYYLIQFRPTLDPSTPWENLTNNYPANGTNLTTSTVYGVAAPCSSGGGGGGGGGNPPSPLMSSEAWSGPMVMPKEGSKNPMPLAIYPWGIDLTGWIIIWPDGSIDEWSAELVEKWRANNQEERDGGGAELDGPTPGDNSGFFRIFHIPNWAFSVTNYVYAGPTFFPVDFKDYLDRVKNIQVFLNNELTDYAEFITLDGTNWGMGIYFDRVTNGTYQIELVTTIALNDEIGDGMVSLALTNLARNIVISNLVTFPDWNDFIQGDTYTFSAKILNPDTDWTIDIYDAFNAYVNTLSGHTTNGQVSATWNLNDWQGNNRDDFDSDPYFYSQITYAAPSGGGQKTDNQPVAVKGFPNRGDWVVSFQDRWFSDAWGYPGDLQGKYEDAVLDIYGGPILVGDTPQWQPLKFGTNVYSQAEREASWSDLRAWLNDLHIRNFYYHGHGGSTSLGCDRHTYSTNGLVTGGVFSYRGSKSTIENWQIASITKYKRFRFVFLDGCSTATGDLPNAFNISKQTNNISFYENHPKHPRPAVFVGWNQVVGGPGWGSAYDRIEFQAFWMGSWANSFPPANIVDALKSANTGAGWVTEGKLWGALRVYGYQEMTIRSYNRKEDWRWP